MLLFDIKTVAQLSLPHYPDSLFTTYYHQKVTHFKSLSSTKNDIIFLGNSITDGAEWSELFGDINIKNRGISGDISAGVINRLEEIVSGRPAKIFLMIGINDLSRNISPDSVLKNILTVSSYIRQESTNTQLYVESVLPVNDVFKTFSGHTRQAKLIDQLNDYLRQNASAWHYKFLDLHPFFCDEYGKLNIKYTNDGLHLTGAGYLLWKHIIYPYVYDLQEKPSLLPQPQKLKWNPDFFSLAACKSIVVKNENLNNDARFLQQYLSGKGWELKIVTEVYNHEPCIELTIAKTEAPFSQDEAYHIEVNNVKIKINASTAHGIFNGLQTLKQLMRDGSTVEACEITDWPAFSWRGYMIDVGRNFQSIKLLKQQIDVMCRYKLNVFHLHLTEDIAWRLESKLYPQLTAAQNMLRNPGEYYTVAELKELIQYCNDRYITLIPEIDMPGHSSAFTRAMKTNMQSDSGMIIVKNILKEICETFNVPFIHVGGDEVRITNENFLPEIIKLINSYGRKTIAWDPGGKVPENTILQMWVGNSVLKKGFSSIDSRHLYLNHFDPIDGVVTTFNHEVCDVPFGDTNRLGATLCNWPDRRVSEEEDVIKMNAVYSVMLTFAERCWRGGGWKNYLSDIDIPGSERYAAFSEFENRLLDQKKQYFKNLPFPYFRQSNIEWKLVGPFNNNGKTSAVFIPESKDFLDTVDLKKYPSVYGGTIWLRHFWHPMIQSHLKKMNDSVTYYAITKIWCNDEQIKDFWIGFNNLSRSTASDSPPIGAWDNRNSAVWVNGKFIEPPQWKLGGQKGNSEIPLIDEGYEYREPTKILLRKGWNTVLIKAPVAAFKGSDWQNPVKWMFTFVQLTNF